MQAQTKQPDFSSIDHIVSTAIDGHKLPGAVVIVGHDGKIVFHKAYGERSLVPERTPMREDTVFDMASITKILATSIAAMVLYDQGCFRLNDPVAKYFPSIAVSGKQDITIRQLMTHYSGLSEGVELKELWPGKKEGFERSFAIAPMRPAGKAFSYSDINFILMGALVEKFSGMSLDEYTAKYVFAPLGMEHTCFLPPVSWRGNIAPTQFDEDHHMLLGVVHDPTARRMGGVAGHAGRFSTAGDVAIYAQSLLDRLQGRPSKFPVNRLTLEKMTTPQQPASGSSLRGLGWDI
jgi:CubicO group peptidase (beta-lactamase class C family)